MPSEFRLLARSGGIARLKKRSGRQYTLNMTNPLVNYLRAQRKRVGLSQRELAFLLGYASEDAISKHELFQSVPPLIMAFGYQAIFRVPISDLFAGLREAVESAIENQIAEFENKLSDQVGKTKTKPSTADLQKLKWLKARRGSSH